ncbi:MAG: hypothetical protein E5Y87_03610, partial [Mesorhizobium sp.]
FLSGIYLITARQYLAMPRFDLQSYREIRTQSLGFSLAGVLAFGGQYMDKIIVARLLGTAELGIYTRAFTLIAMPANLFGNLSRTVVFPLLSKVQTDEARLRSAQLKGYALTAALTLPTSAFLCCFAKEIVLTMFGPRWVDAVVPIAVFSAAMYFRVAFKLCGAVMLATGSG